MFCSAVNLIKFILLTGKLFCLIFDVDKLPIVYVLRITASQLQTFFVFKKCKALERTCCRLTKTSYMVGSVKVWTKIWKLNNSL